MRTSQKLTHALLALAALVVLASAALAQLPGTPWPATDEINDQKAGSVLIYTVYSSSAANANAENTRFNLTNTSSVSSAFVHLFFVDGNSCSVADAFICLTPNQTTSFLASDVDPGTMGFVVAVAASPITGCPINFNFLIGDEFVKFATGHAANLGAEAIAAILTTPVESCNAASVSADLAFNGVAYNRLPRVLAADSIGSPADGDSTLLVIDRIGGNLLTGTGTIGNLFGILFDEAEHGFSFTFFSAACQVKAILSDNFPRTTPRFSAAIPAGSHGWLKIFNPNVDRGYLGAEITRNANSASAAGAFNGGHNLHKLTLTAAETLLIPIFPPTC